MLEPVDQVTLEVTKITEDIDWTGIPYNLQHEYRGKVSAVCTTLKQCQDLGGFFGNRQFAPYLPVLVIVPTDPLSVRVIMGDGVAPAAELQDLAVVTWERTMERMAKDQDTIFDEYRERRGLMRREDVDEAARTAFHDRSRKHKQNPITDPAKVSASRKPNPDFFAMGDSSE